VTGNPVAFHAMRGLAAHSKGFKPSGRWPSDDAARHHRPAGRFRHKRRSRADSALRKTPNTPLA